MTDRIGKGDRLFLRERLTWHMLERFVPRIPRRLQGGYAYHVINRRTDAAPYSTNHRTTKLLVSPG